MILLGLIIAFTHSGECNSSDNSRLSVSIGAGGVGGGRRRRKAPMLPDEQKVSPVPDIIVQNRSREEDEFVILACDGIWDVQTNHECVGLVQEIFSEGGTDLRLLCEEVSRF